MMEEFRANGDRVWEGTVPGELESSRDFIKRLLNEDSAAHYWAVLGNLVVGRISFRFLLTDLSKEFGGNIGYEVRPSVRGKGIASEMLRLVLETPKAKEVGEILLTCSPDNVASIKTILKNNGKLEKTAFVERVKRQTNYYLIRL